MVEERHDMLKKDEPKPDAPPFEGEETKENPEEGETSESKAPVSEQETEENKPEVAEKDYDDEIVTRKELNKLYARAKTAEEKAKKAEAKLVQARKPVSDVDAILEVQKATKGLDEDEVAELQLRAKAMGVPLSDARQNENFKIWRDGRKAKVEKEKALNPSTAQSEVESKKSKSLDQRLKEAKTSEEQAKILNELTYTDAYGTKHQGMNPLKARNY